MIFEISPIGVYLQFETVEIHLSSIRANLIAEDTKPRTNIQKVIGGISCF